MCKNGLVPNKERSWLSNTKFLMPRYILDVNTMNLPCLFSHQMSLLTPNVSSHTKCLFSNQMSLLTPNVSSHTKCLFSHQMSLLTPNVVSYKNNNLWPCTVWNFQNKKVQIKPSKKHKKTVNKITYRLSRWEMNAPWSKFQLQEARYTSSYLQHYLHCYS